jgi:hypothetical protein
MEMLLAFAVGFVLGGHDGPRDRRAVVDSFSTIGSSEEVAALVMVARSHVGQTLRTVADLVDGSHREPVAAPDLVDRVRALVQR